MKSSQVTNGNTANASEYNNLREDAKGASTLLASAQTSPNMTVKVEAGTVYVGSVRVAYAGGNSPTFTAPVGNPRIDLLYITPAGTLTILQGTAAGSPVAPSIPNGVVPICYVYLRTSTTQIRDTDIGSQGYISADLRPIVYFAPRDNMEMPFTADENLTAGQTVGISNYSPTSRVARALRRNTTVALGFTPDNIDDLSEQEKTCPIGGNKFVSVFRTGTSNLSLSVFSIDENTKTITKGTTSSFSVTSNSNGSATYFGVCKLDTDKFIIFYNIPQGIYYRVCTVSGTTISLGTQVAYSAYAIGTYIQHLVPEQIATDKGVLYINNSNGSTTRVVAFTVSGSTVTFGSLVTPDTNVSGGHEVIVRKVATDKFCILSGSGYVQLGTISGTTISLGSAYTFGLNVTNAIATMRIVNPSDNVLVLGWRNSTSSGIDMQAVSVSGTVPTFGTILSTVFTSTVSYLSLTVESSTSFIAVEASNNTVKRITLSGTTLTDGGVVINQHINSSTAMRSGLKLDGGAWIILGLSGTTFGAYIQGMSNTFLGFAQSTVSRGATVNVMFRGKDANQSNLVQGMPYQPDGAGGLTAISLATTINSVDDEYVIAASATEVIK